MSIRNRKAKSADAVSFDIIGGKDVMPIGAFLGPFSRDDADKKNYPEFVTEAFIEKCGKCGINLFVYPHENFEAAPESVYKALRLCEKYHIGYFSKHNYFSRVFDGKEQLDRNKVKAIIGELSEYPAFVGIHTKDEPVTPYFNHLKEINDVFYSVAREGLQTYANLYPQYYWGIRYDGKKEGNCTYAEYVERYIREIRPRFLSYDHYVFEAYNGTYRTNTDDYFSNLSMIRQKAEENHIPFWVFVQAGGYWNDAGEELPVIEHFPYKGDFFWNVSTQLAYGAKGIQYFPLIQITKFAKSENGVLDYRRNGLFGADGRANKWYGYAREANAHIRSVGDVLMNAVNEGVVVSGVSAAEIGQRPEVIASGKYFELDEVSGDAVVGCFQWCGRTALYVANGLRKKQGRVVLTFDDLYRFSVVQKAEKRLGEGKSVTLLLEPGEGALVVLE